VTITSPIKSTGDHEATVRLHEDVLAVITLQVVAAK
jgi:large subunit ribosomal protein L9